MIDIYRRTNTSEMNILRIKYVTLSNAFILQCLAWQRLAAFQQGKNLFIQPLVQNNFGPTLYCWSSCYYSVLPLAELCWPFIPSQIVFLLSHLKTPGHLLRMQGRVFS